MTDTMMTDQPAEQPVMGMRRRSPQWGDLMTALAKAQGEIEGAKKDSQNPHFKSNYADLASVMTAIREPLAKNGVAVTQWPRVVDGAVEIETILAHGEQFISDVLWMPCAKMDAHGIGSAITYGRRYALMAAAGVAPEDDDGNGAVDGHKPGAPGSAGGGTQFRSPGRRTPPMAGGPTNDWVGDAERDGIMDHTRQKGTLPAANGKAKAAVNAVELAQWCKDSVNLFKTIQTKPELVDWWKANLVKREEAETAMPNEWDRVVIAYDARMDTVAAKGA